MSLYVRVCVCVCFCLCLCGDIRCSNEQKKSDRDKETGECTTRKGKKSWKGKKTRKEKKRKKEGEIEANNRERGVYVCL
ncbi:hypothetical protein BCR43DRAFT_497573 [Syncephalastrum racemosum]|uniref:Secreted protein n=1 Tax=Syncephalastrum racemosum TaxID=13706 RepID=A0A1X2H2E0_SYNRA|nr:hypothetical protein BCR43DRAFT_497573 [Syncephalastrum racemosum]